MNILLAIYLAEILVVNGQSEDNRLDDELRLSKELVASSKYNKNLRPSYTTFLYIDLYMKQLMSVDEKTQTITTNSYLNVRWDDPRLKWEPTVTKRIPSKSLKKFSEAQNQIFYLIILLFN